MNFLSRSRKVCQNEQIKSRKNFPVNLSPDKPETGFLFFRVVEEIFIFLFSLSECTFSPQERKVSRSKQNMSFLCENHFQQTNPESLTNLKSPIRSLVVIVPKLKKSTFFLRKSARNCPSAKVVRSRKSVKSKLSVYVK